MEISKETKDKAVALVQEFRDECKSSLFCNQWLFQDTAICLALLHTRKLVSVTSKKSDYILLKALEEIQIEHKIKTNNNEK